MCHVAVVSALYNLAGFVIRHKNLVILILMIIVFGRNGAMSIFERFSSKCLGKRQFNKNFINENYSNFDPRLKF